jgi:peptidoglycan/LPS O-acetylase OafA/YrhL
VTARLGWLDALRGFAALTVVWFHLSPLMLGNQRHLAIMRHLDLGKYGVLLFFLVSGYVIPMSLERHGSLRRFWIGRLCRVYPAYLGAIALVGLIALAGWGSWQQSFSTQTVSAVLGHATMMTELLGLHGAVRVFWTLSYEMTFYLVVSGLFAWRLHRHSAWWAAGLALAGLLLGPILPDGLFAATAAGRRATAVVVALLLSASVVAYVRKKAILAAGAVGIGFVLLPALDGHPTPDSTAIASWQGLDFLAVMFAGTVVYRAHSGRLSRLAAGLSLTVVALGVIGAHAARLGPSGLRLWTANVAAVAITFLLAYAVRNRPVPAFLTWLGRISYSLYLLHAIVLLLIPRIVPGLPAFSPAARASVGLAYLAVVLLLAWASYRMVEIPGQALGRRLAVDRTVSPLSVPRPARGGARTGAGASRLDT